ncbi:phosphatidylserine decarboxylase [Acidobacteriota bacterium]
MNTTKRNNVMKGGHALILLLVMFLCISLFAPAEMAADDNPLFKYKPYVPVVKELKKIFEDHHKVRKAFSAAIKKVKALPPNPREKPRKNVWEKRTYTEFCNFFNNWYDFLATPEKAGLGFITPFTSFYYNNHKAFHFLNEFELHGKKVIFDWTVKFIVERGKFMDTPSPQASEAIKEWVTDPATHIDDFIMPDGGYKTFNDFFARLLRPGARPISAVGDESVVVSPADSELNMINSILTESSKIPTKGTQKLGIKDLLNNYPGWDVFLYGNALSCVLLPANYHHYHAPVTGNLIHSEIVPGLYNGIEDAPEWFHNGNVGSSDADFSIFEQFHRGIFIFRTKKFGDVAMVVVGLNTISEIGFEMSSVNTLEQYTNASPQEPIQVFKGDRLGYFKYGGSLNILLFQHGVYEGVKVHQGQRIGTMNPPTKPSAK